MKNVSSHSPHFSRCPTCKKEYDLARLSLVKEDLGRDVFHVTCDTCHSSVIFVLNAGQFGVMSVGVLTDLVSEEVEGFIRADEITGDQVLDAYQSLQEYDGSISQLFSSERRK